MRQSALKVVALQKCKQMKANIQANTNTAARIRHECENNLGHPYKAKMQHQATTGMRALGKATMQICCKTYHTSEELKDVFAVMLGAICDRDYG
jgi:hypothetical protein